MLNKTGIFALGVAALFLSMVATASAGVLSESTAKVTQLRIVHAGKGNLAKPAQPDAWGTTSDYIGPGDIHKVMGVEIYLDTEQRISAIKIKRESYAGDIVTSIFTRVIEFSVQTLKEDVNRPHNVVSIKILTADSITFP